MFFFARKPEMSAGDERRRVVPPGCLFSHILLLFPLFRFLLFEIRLLLFFLNFGFNKRRVQTRVIYHCAACFRVSIGIVVGDGGRQWWRAMAL